MPSLRENGRREAAQAGASTKHNNCKHIKSACYFRVTEYRLGWAAKVNEKQNITIKLENQIPEIGRCFGRLSFPASELVD